MTRRRGGDPLTLRAIERHLLSIHREKVLSKEFTKLGEHVAKTAEHWKIAPDCIALLCDVDHEDTRNGQDSKPNHKNEERR